MIKPNTARSQAKKNSVDTSSFLYLGKNGAPNALQSDIYSARSSIRKQAAKSTRPIDKLRDSGNAAASPRRQVFDNNSYALVKNKLNKSPKMADYI